MSASSLQLALLHTNDIHSHFEHMPRIAAILSELRTAHQGAEGVLTVDVGDHMDRMRVETEGTNGEANVAVMNHTGYDYAVPGNNEGITFTPEVWKAAIAHKSRFTVVCSNLFDPATGKPPVWMQRYVIHQAGRLKVGLIAVTAYYPDFYHPIGWYIHEPFEVVRELVDQIRHQVDVIVLLSHLGHPSDIRMATEIAGIDVILGGHTHHLLETPQRIGNTYLCAAGKFGQYVGETIVHYDLIARRVERVEGQCHRVGDGPEDMMLKERIAHFRAIGRSRLSSKVTSLREPLAIRWDDESALGNLLAAGLRRHTGAEIGLVNAGQLLHSLCEGVVTRETLLALCPSPINPCRMRLSGVQIRQALEESLLHEFRFKPITGFGFRGKLLGSISVDGMQIDYDPSADPYCKIVRMTVNGVPFQNERYYTVGTIDMFSFGVGYLSLKESEQYDFFLPEFIRDVVATELSNESAIVQAKQPRWFINNN